MLFIAVHLPAFQPTLESTITATDGQSTTWVRPTQPLTSVPHTLSSCLQLSFFPGHIAGHGASEPVPF